MAALLSGITDWYCATTLQAMHGRGTPQEYVLPACILRAFVGHSGVGERAIVERWSRFACALRSVWWDY